MNLNRIHPESKSRTDLISRGPVIVWLTRDFRLEDNWAVWYGQAQALELKVPLVVVMAIRPDLRSHSGTTRMLDFWMAGIGDLQSAAGDKAIGFRLLHGDPPNEVAKFSHLHKASLIVTDFWPTQPGLHWIQAARSWKLPVVTIDAHNIVPVWTASDKQEYAAYTFRPKINKLLPQFLELPKPLIVHPHTFANDRPISVERFAASIAVDRRVTLPSHWKLGSKGANQTLDRFLSTTLKGYATRKNFPELNHLSQLSAYLHFGLISAQRVANAVLASEYAKSEDATSFLEEMIVRRELSENFCYYQPKYRTVSGFPAWAQRSHAKHCTDLREYCYSLQDFEDARTHDSAWNAAQRQMVITGKMHGYMRMYWAKKILEWTESPQMAMDYAIYLNDKYELDGRDPNGYTGIAWSIGGVHDRPWFERPIYGQVRYMALSGLERKFDLDAYIRSIR